MLHGFALAYLEVRAAADGSRHLRGRFPYGRPTILGTSARGDTYEEQFAARALAPQDDVHLLVGHDFDRPLASRATRTLELRNGDDALSFEATITPDIAGTTHARDVLKLVDAGLATGLSPGFRLAPGPDAERVEHRAGGVLRTVRSAQLFELSIVTRPAYDAAQVEARSWEQTMMVEAADASLRRAFARWRA